MSEITYDYIIQYIRALHVPPKDVLLEIETAVATGKETWPIIKPEVADLIRVLLTTKKPEHILEIGTAVGYSGILMSHYLPPHGTLTTIERYEKMYTTAEKNIERAGLKDKISILKGDAKEILPTLPDGSYDVVFMDCAKGQYSHFLPDCLRLLKPNGLLIADNILHKGMVAKARYLIDRRQRTTHCRLRQFLWDITHSPQLTTSIIPIGDGVSLSYKLEDTHEK
jgi:predicted O-methyltransferase YrrM